MNSEKNELFKLIGNNNHREIAKLIINEKNILTIDSNKNNIFHLLGIFSNGKEIAKILIKNNYGELLQSKNKYGDTPLCGLMRWHSNNSLDIAKIYIEADPNTINGTSNTKSTEIYYIEDYDSDIESSPLSSAIEFNALKIAKLLINNNANLNARDNKSKTALFHCVANPHYNEITKLLIKKGANLKLNGYIYTVRRNRRNGEKRIHLLYYGWTLLNEAIKYNNNEIVKILIENDVDINEIDEDKNSPLKNSYDMNNKDITKLLLQKGANIEDNYDETLNYKEHAYAYKKKKQWFLDLINYQNNPQKLVKILTNFRKDTPIKYTTHLWDMNLNNDYGNFDGYMARVTEQWEEIESELKSLSPNIHRKVYDFLINKSPDTNWCSKDGDDISIGWSSLEGLKEWCDGLNNPFKFELKEKSCKVENKTISTFGDVINLFKQEIQIRNENDILESIFLGIEERLDDEFDGLFEIETIKLKGKSFYTDVEKFQDVVDRVFSEIKKREKFNKIVVEMREYDDYNYMDLTITQIDSSANRTKEEMLKISDGGDMAEIKKSLRNLCDWSVETSNEGYRIDYLGHIDTEIESRGFTHRFRFYR